MGSISGLGRSPGEGNGYPLQYSGLENFMNCIVHGVTKSWTRKSSFHLTLQRSPHQCILRPSCSSYNVTLIHIHQEMESMLLLLEPGGWLISASPSRMWQKECYMNSETRSRVAIWLPSGSCFPTGGLPWNHTIILWESSCTMERSCVFVFWATASTKQQASINS